MSGISRDDALILLQSYVKNENMIKHSLASETVLRALARKLGHDEETWGIAGLLHDIDIEVTGADMSVHGMVGARILEEKGVDPVIADAVRMHNEAACGAVRSTVFHHALAAGETITGLIMATAMVYPDKKLQSVKPPSIVKRMKEKAFAASVNRDTIRECEKIGIPLGDFADISLSAMKGISGVLGL